MIRACLFCLILVATSYHAYGKDPIPTPDDGTMIGDVDKYLLSTLYQTDKKDASLADIVEEPLFQRLVAKHRLLLFGGPMLGNVTDTTADLWVRTPGPSQVQIVTRAEGVPEHLSPIQVTDAEHDFTAVLTLEGLRPQTRYNYNVLVNGEPVFSEQWPDLQTFRRKGKPMSFSVAFGGGARYNPSKERMWETIASFQPDLLLMLGDNVYIDLPNDRTKQRVHYYRRQLRPEFQTLISRAAVYSIWDDHDFGANDCAGGLDPFQPAWKVPVWKVFQENWVNPAYGGGSEQPGCWYSFSVGDVDFFMTDGRYYRDFSQKTMLGPVQKKWLLETLAKSTATFKVICSGTLWTELADKNGKDSWWGVPEEREEIFRLIDQNGIGGVFLLSADRHRSDIYRIERPDGYPLYEFETSKLTNDHGHQANTKALYSWDKGNFFGMLRFDFDKQDPEVAFENILIDGEVVHTHVLKRSDLEK